MFCSNCGKEVRDDASFCPDCGSKIEGTNLSTNGNEDAGKELVYQNNDNSGITEVVNTAQDMNPIQYPPYGQMPPKDAKDNANKFKFWQGRLDRKRYLGASIVLFLPFSIATASYREAGDPAGLFVAIVLLVLWMIASIRRCHDFNSSGWKCILLFVPIVSAVFWFYLLFKAGTSGPNDYGNQQS